MDQVISDAKLVRAVVAGQREQFAALVRRYERAVCAAAEAVVRDHHAARDAAQEAFLTAYAKLPSLRNASAFGRWVIKIARRKALRMARQRQETVPYVEAGHAPASGDGRLDDASQELLAAVVRLPAHERLVLMLRYFQGRNLAEIAAITDRSVGTVSKQLSRAHQRLRQWLREYES